MARPRLEIGEHGKITIAELPDKRYRARARFRGVDGTVRPVEAIGRTKTKAERALKDRVKERVGDRDSKLGGDTLLKDLAGKWWETIERRCDAGDLNPDTRREYLRYRDRVIEACGDLAIREATVGRLETAINQSSGDKSRTASEMKRTLVGMFKYAVRMKAIDHNPATDVELVTRKPKSARAATLEELNDMRGRIQAYETSGGSDAPRIKGKGRGGRPRSKYLSDVFEVQLAIWGRIGEVLALQWETDMSGMDDDGPIHIWINATLKHRSKAEAERLGLPAGLYRQEHPKTETGNRVWKVTGTAAMVLRRLYNNRTEGVPWVFATSRGTPLNPSNIRTALRKARGEEYEWFVPHTLRRTGITHGLVATKDLAAVAGAAGHSRFTTTEGYTDKRHFSFDFSPVMESLGNKSGLETQNVG